MVFAELVIAWRFAIWPMSRSPFSVNATTDGVVRPPSLFGTICVTPPSNIATQEFVVPRSIPITLPMMRASYPIKPRKVERGLVQLIGAGGELHIADFGLPIVDWNSGIRNPKSIIRNHFS